jgi:flavodoxin
MAKGSRTPQKKNTGTGKKPAKPSKGRSLQPEDKLALARIVCDLYETDKHTLEYCLNEAGIGSRTTWFRWLQEMEQIEQIYKEAQDRKATVYKQANVERARTALEKALVGFEKVVEEREGYYKVDPETGDFILDDQGQRIFIPTKVKRKVIYIPPKLGAIVYTLNNADKSNFERNPEGETEKKDRGAFDDWTDEQILEELKRLNGEG